MRQPIAFFETHVSHANLNPQLAAESSLASSTTKDEKEAAGKTQSGHSKATPTSYFGVFGVDDFHGTTLRCRVLAASVSSSMSSSSPFSSTYDIGGRHSDSIASWSGDVWSNGSVMSHCDGTEGDAEVELMGMVDIPLSEFQTCDRVSREGG